MAMFTNNDDAMIRAMKEVLINDTRKMLKEPLMQIAEEHIDKAVNAAVAGLEVKVEAYLKHYEMEKVYNVTVKHVAPLAAGRAALTETKP